MSRTEQALNKLNELQRRYIEVNKDIYSKCRAEGNEALRSEYWHEISGYCTALKHSGIINVTDERLIRTYATL